MVMSPPARSTTAWARVVLGPKWVMVAWLPSVMSPETALVEKPVLKSSVALPSWPAVPATESAAMLNGELTVTVKADPAPSLFTGLGMVAVSPTALG